MDIKNMFCTLVMITTMALTGCGGGGGGVTPTPGPTPPPGGGSLQLTESQLYGSIERYREVAANAPQLGSITQSSNGNNGISTDRVETMLHEGGALTVIVKDGNGNVSLELDSRQHMHTNLNGTAWMNDEDSDFPQGWSGNGWVLSKQDGGDVVVALSYALWEDTDDTNYLAGGYWVKGNEDDGVTEMGAFGDAGEGSIFSYYDDSASSWQRPITGTATYLGSAEGAYVDPAGDAGVWWSRLKLDANFSTNSITGCVGCREAAPNEAGIYTYTTIDDLKKDQWTFNDLSISLDGQNNINNDGSFEGTLDVVGITGTSTGKWGGLFSENSNASTSPSMLVGSLGGTTSQGHGFIGVFLGQK